MTRPVHFIKNAGWVIIDNKDREKNKKQVPLRLSTSLWNELTAWAEDDFRSLNGQIEYLLTECVKRRRKQNTKLSDDNDENNPSPDTKN